jgi:tetratricopeptide (TPR) repeat protein
LVNQQGLESDDDIEVSLTGYTGRPPASIPIESLTPVQRAQYKMYEAWGASGLRRVGLAREALDISPLCADAYVLLAEETAQTAAEALKLYELGMQMGEVALGPEVVEQQAGHFWGILETRPYMRAREGVAASLVAMGQLDKAIPHCRELLRLNPDDNQGIRYLLARALLGQGMEEDLLELLRKYDDASADWAYTRALAIYRLKGSGRRAGKELRNAFMTNPWVPAYALGLKKAPRRAPEYSEPGEGSEAIFYLAYNWEAWENTPGAIEWFIQEFAKFVEEVDRHGEPL